LYSYSKANLRVFFWHFLPKLKRKCDINEEKAICIKLLLESGKIPISYLNLASNSLTDRAIELIFSGARSLQNNDSKLRFLLLDSCGLLAQTGIRIAHFISLQAQTKTRPVQLRVLTISRNKLGDIAIEQIAKSLERGTLIKYLDLSENEFGDSGLNSIGNAICSPKCKIVILCLLGNKFTDIGIKGFTKALANTNESCSLTILKIEHFESTEDSFIDFLLEGIKRCQSLKFVYIITPYFDSIAIEKINNSVTYKKVICTESLDHRHYNKTALIDIIYFENTKQQENISELIQNFIINNRNISVTLEILIYLVSQNILPLNKPISNGLYLSHLLCEACYYDGLYFLIKHGIPLLLPTSIGNKNFPYCSILHISAYYGHHELLQNLILEFTQKTDTQNNQDALKSCDLHGNTILHYAAKEGRIEVCKLICEILPELALCRNKMRNLPIHCSIYKDKLDTFQYLTEICYEQMPNKEESPKTEVWEKLRGEGGAPAPILVAKYGAKNIFDYIMEKKIKLLLQDDKLKTMLHWALESNESNEIAIKLMKYHYKDPIIIKQLVNMQDENGQTPAYYVIRRSFFEGLIELSNAGADLSKQDKKGNTLLHYAARMDRADIIGFLIEKGVNLHIRNLESYLPYDLATKPHIKKMLSPDVENTSNNDAKSSVLGPAPTLADKSQEILSNVNDFVHDDKSVYGNTLEVLPQKQELSIKSGFAGFLPKQTGSEFLRADTITGVFTEASKIELENRNAKTETNSLYSGPISNFALSLAHKKPTITDINSNVSITQHEETGSQHTANFGKPDDLYTITQEDIENEGSNGEKNSNKN